MSLRINNNITSLTAYNNLNRSSSKMDKAIGKISSGSRINSAADDAAGLAISEKMKSQIRSLNRANFNAQDAVSMLQTAEGSLGETESIIHRMRELAIQASNDTLASDDRLAIQKEIDQLCVSINDLSRTTEFNTKKLLNGSQTALVSTNSDYVSAILSGDVDGSGDYTIDAKLLERGCEQIQTSNLFLDKNTGEMAKGNTRLEDIKQFYDSKGVFVLDTPQKLTISNNSASAEVTVHSKMTLDQLASAIQNAMTSSKGLELKDSIVEMVPPTSYDVGGYLSITSGAVGERGDFSISGEQSLMNALNFSITRESKNNYLQLTATDDYGNKKTIRTSQQNMKGLIEGVDVVFAPELTDILSTARLTTNVDIIDAVRIPNTPYHGYGASNYPIDMWVSVDATPGHNNNVISVNIDVYITSPQDYSFDDIVASYTSDINTLNRNSDGDKSWNPNTGLYVSIVNNQICISKVATADSPTTQFTIRQWDTRNTTNYLGIPNGTYNGRVIGSKDPSVAIRGIRHPFSPTAAPDIKFNVSDGSSTTTVDFGRPIGASSSILEINGLITKINSQMAAAGVDVVAKIENDSIVFFSTQPEHLPEITPFDDTNTVQMNYINNDIGIPYTKAKYFDKSFVIHVVDRSPQFQIGANVGQNMKINISDMSTKALGLDGLDLTYVEGAQRAIKRLDRALNIVAAERSRMGAYTNRLDYTRNDLDTAAINLTDSESRIRDADVALETINLTSAKMMQQVGTTFLAQANSMSSTVLSLLQ